MPILAAAIRRLHGEAVAASTTAAERAIEAGRALVEAKGLVAHGGWLTFLAEAGIPKRTAQRYMRLAESDLKSDTVTHLGGIAAALHFLRVRERMCDELAALEAANREGRERSADLLGELLCDLARMLDAERPEAELPVGEEEAKALALEAEARALEAEMAALREEVESTEDLARLARMRDRGRAIGKRCAEMRAEAGANHARLCIELGHDRRIKGEVR